MAGEGRPLMQLDRLKAASDGVLAIVLTILVLSLEVPDHEFSREGVLTFLGKNGVQVLAYVVSFGITATYWVQHSAMFHYIRVGNRTLTWLNLLFLLPVTMLPFFTDMRVKFHGEYIVTIMYASVNALCGLILLLIWRYSVSRGLTYRLAPGVDGSMSRRIFLGVGLNALGAAIAPVSVHLSGVVFLSLPVIYFSHSYVDSRWASPEPGAGEAP